MATVVRNLLHLQGLLLSAYLKMLLSDPENAKLQHLVGDVFDRYSRYIDAGGAPAVTFISACICSLCKCMYHAQIQWP